MLFDRRGADGVDRPGTIADFAWPDRRVAVFCDGWEHHSTPDQRAADAAKRDRARDRGWTVLAFWGGQIVRRRRRLRLRLRLRLPDPRRPPLTASHGGIEEDAATHHPRVR